MGEESRRDVGYRRAGGIRGAIAVVVVIAVAMLSLLVLFPFAVATRTPVREITLVARDMTFYVEGETTPNPTIWLAPGEEVQFSLHNADPGIAHNLAIMGWQLETARLKTGASATFRVRAPEDPTRQRYVCTPHRQMMGGLIVVAAPSR